MKLIFLFALIFSVPAIAQESIYDLNVQTAYGGELSLNYYREQKIAIASVSVDMLRRKGPLEFWDSLKTAYPKVVFIMIPASDMDTLTNDSIAMEEIKSNASKKFVLSGAEKVKKDKGEEQNPVMQWLTDAKKNQRSNMEVESEFQIYVVSESGILYSVLTKGTPLWVLKSVLEQPDVKPNVYGELKP
jgi:glutathione peroxidase-family protein